MVSLDSVIRGILFIVLRSGNILSPVAGGMRSSPQGGPCPTVFIDVAIRGVRAGRVIILLRTDVVPKTAENFRALCTGEKGIGTLGKPLHFKGCRFHRAVSQFMVQGGDIISNSGQSGESIYGKKFDDENFLLSHVTGAVSMANEGKPNTNSSQFFVSTVPCTHLDGKNVVFGKVLKGLGLITEIDKCKQGPNNVLTENCVIIDSGELLPGQDWNYCDSDYIGDTLPPYPADYEYYSAMNLAIKDKVVQIKNSGNVYYSQHQYQMAHRKYEKGMRYIHWIYDKLENKNSYDDNHGGVLLKALMQLEINCLMNLSATKLKLKEYKEVVDLCSQVLQFEPYNIKAIFRRGKANMQLNNYTIGLKDLILARSLSPNDKLIKIELKKSQDLHAKYVDYEKSVYKKMFPENF